jgi:polyisoprenoid-binding protein YceI
METATKTKWTLDPTHSELGFKIKHLMITNVTGKFGNFDVKVQSPGDDFSSADIAATIDVASISTNNEQRDGHLRTGDFFETEKFPKMKFRSTGIKKLGDDEFELTGELTIKDVTKPVKLAVELGGVSKDPWGNTKAGFSFKGKLNRTDWGLNYNAALETGGILLSEEVKLEGEIQLVKQAA